MPRMQPKKTPLVPFVLPVLTLKYCQLVSVLQFVIAYCLSHTEEGCAMNLCSLLILFCTITLEPKADKGRHSTDPWPILQPLDIFPTPLRLQNMPFIAYSKAQPLSGHRMFPLKKNKNKTVKNIFFLLKKLER